MVSNGSVIAHFVLLCSKSSNSPGQAIARASVWLTVGSILAAFNIEKAIGPDGKNIEPTEEVKSLLVWYATVQHLDAAFLKLKCHFFTVLRRHSTAGSRHDLKKLND